MNEIHTEFLVFIAIGAALGALCLLPVALLRLGGSLGRGRSEPANRGSMALADVLAPEPADARIRALEYDAVESRIGRRRATAVRSLRELGQDDSVTTLVVAALDPNHIVRSEAARGIAEIADPHAVEPLVHAVAGARSRRSDAARAAILGLGPTALPELRRLEREDPDPRTRRVAAKLEHALA